MHIYDLKPIFSTRTKSQEILLLLSGAKKVVRQGFYESELGKVIEFFEKNNIFLVKSKFKVLLSDKGEPFSNKGMRVGEDNVDGMYFVYLSLDKKSAYLASYYEITQDHKNLGLILGYPECCVDYFCNHFSEQNPNPEQKPTNPYTNLSKREQDYVLLSHFPCNSDCEKSIELGKKYLQIIKENDEEYAEILVRKLSL